MSVVLLVHSDLTIDYHATAAGEKAVNYGINIHGPRWNVIDVVSQQ